MPILLFNVWSQVDLGLFSLYIYIFLKRVLSLHCHRGFHVLLMISIFYAEVQGLNTKFFLLQLLKSRLFYVY